MSSGLETRDVMTAPAITVSADASVTDAAELFAATGVGALPVCDGDGHPIGVVTDRDLVVRVLCQDRDGLDRPVREVAEPQPVVADAGAPLARTVATMRRHGLRRLPVVDGSRVVGVVSREDLVRCVPLHEADELHRIDGGASDQRSGRWAFERAYA